MMDDANDHATLHMSVNDDNELIVAMSGNFPNGASDNFKSLVVLGFGLTNVLHLAQEDVMELGLEYMKEYGITFQSILDREAGRKVLH